MQWAAITATALLFLQTSQGPVQQGQQGQQRQIPPASIEGFVLQSASGDPIAKATVTLSRTITPPPNPTAATLVTPASQIPPALTDAAGKFSFTDLEPGSYRISAGRNGFVRMNYG